MQILSFVKAVLFYGATAQQKDTAHNAWTAPEQHGQADPKDVFAVDFWLHQVGQDSLNQHVNSPNSERQAGSKHVDVVQNTFLGKEIACTELWEQFSLVNLWHSTHSAAFSHPKRSIPGTCW